MSSYDSFAEIYDEWSAHMTADVPFYVELARERAPAAGVQLDLREADMRELQLEEPASLVWEYIEHSKRDNRIDVTAFGGEPGAEPRTVSLWWATRSEWEGLVDAAGLEVEELHGWFDGRPFDDQSPEFVWIARKPS